MARHCFDALHNLEIDLFALPFGFLKGDVVSLTKQVQLC